MKIRIRKMNWFVRLMTLNWPVAITIMPFGIYVKPDYLKDEQTIRHEMIHARQQLEMFILPFYVWYLVEWLIRLVINYKMAYMSVSFEREAYQNDDSPAYKADPDKKYVLEQINEAITSLQDSSRQLTEIVTGQRELDF